MTKTLFASLLLVLATPAIAADAPAEKSFTRDGVTYVYTTRADGDLTIIEGRNVTTGETFALSVRNGQVDGTYDGRKVSFYAPSKFGVGAIAAR
jgi:hypothetical protein